MTPTMQCPEARVSLGVYVLGAIDPAERALVEAHLATCRDCRDELAGLAALPALLARVTAEEAMALAASDGPPPIGPAGAPEAPPELLATVIDLTAARRRRRRWRDASLAVAAALIIAVGVFGGLRIGGGATSPPAASGVNYPGQANGPWRTVTTSAMAPGLHYYTIIVDGAEVSDPGSTAYFGGSKWASAVEVPEAGADYYLPEDVPHGQVREI